MIKPLSLTVILLCSMLWPAMSALAADKHQISELKITTLSTMLASRGIGEWGYSALIQADGRQLLFDTGGRPEVVLNNARELGIDLSGVEEVFLSHNHGDHTGGLLTLRAALKKQNPKALSRVHVAEGIFSERATNTNEMIAIRRQLEKDGVSFIVHRQPIEIFPGVWTTGQVERIHNERNWGGKGKIKTDHGHVEDNIPEDQSVAIVTNKGVVLVSGCGHAGIINTLAQVEKRIDDRPVHAAIGGFHLVNASDDHLGWTARQLKGFGVAHIVGAHCTGINALYSLREMLGLTRRSAVVGSVGDSFELGTGIRAGYIAR